jgi:alkylated DNA repair protein (DNA oxidative demethylase)
MTQDLFGFESDFFPKHEQLGEQAVVLRGFAQPYIDDIITALPVIAASAPFRHMATPGGYTMSVAMTNCGPVGGIVDQHGYRYTTIDPVSGNRWPAMPAAFMALAHAAAEAAGFTAFVPDSCLINRYVPDARMSLHQDKSERDLTAPIVSVSLGMPALFLFGGHQRSDRARRVPLLHGDVLVWGGVDRLRFHGVMPVKANTHPVMGDYRFNLTIRQAG